MSLPHGKDVRRKSVWIPICVAFLCLSLFVGTFVGWQGRSRVFQATGNSADYSGRSILFDINLVSIDTTAGTMLLDWYIFNDTACDQLGLKNTNNATLCSPLVNIFFDKNVLRGTTDPTNPGDNNIPTTPLFSWNATANNLADDRPGIPAFRTSLTLLTTIGSGVTNQQDYPFDSYYCDLFVFAQDSTNTTVGARIHSTSGIAVGYTAQTQRLSNSNGSAPDINDRIAILRTGLVKAYALVIVMTMWAITLVFVMATILGVFFGYRQRIELLAIPVATLFAFPQLRSSMPGAPIGGTIVDYVGVLPCLALTSVCAALTLAFVVFVDPEMYRDYVITPKGTNSKGQQIVE